MGRIFRGSLALVCLAALACGGRQERRPGREEGLLQSDMGAKLKQFAPTEVGGVGVPEKHRPVIRKLIQAAQGIDRLFLVQVARENPGWREAIARDPALGDTLAYFDIMYGPWDRLDEDRPFWGRKAKPPGVAFYPEDLTRAELEAWIAAHPDQKAAFTGYHTVIERDGQGLRAVPYSEAYRPCLEPVAGRLEGAAALAEDARLARYLRSRAAAFRSNDYRPSDFDWMDLGDGDIEIVIGPYEVYEDELMGYKAAFEAFIALRDPVESGKLARIQALVPAMEEALPIPGERKNRGRGTDSPIAVVNLLYSAGDTRAGVQTMAFNLPNDEVVRERKGSKKVMLKNVAHAKFDQILMPIARALLDPASVRDITFEAFFNHTLLHETAHGLGPGLIRVARSGGSEQTSVNQALKDLYSVIEEAKADVLGLYLNFVLIEKGELPEAFLVNAYATYVAGLFRAVRFGADEAHGMANLIQLNDLMARGAVIRTDGRYACDPNRMRDAVEQLARELLLIEALGDYPAARALIESRGKLAAGLAAELAALGAVPTDIRPIYPAEAAMASW